VDVRFALAVLAACSGSKTTPKVVHEDARRDASGADVALHVDPGKGDVQIRVEWKDVPVDARASPGRTTCGTARTASVAPTTTWGIGDVFVAIDVPADKKPSTHRVVLADCALSPRASISSGTLAIASAMQTPTKVTLQRAGAMPLGTALKEDKPRDVFLPIAGHEVELALDAGTIYRIAAGDESAWIVATDHPFVAVTEPSGTVLLRDVRAGTHAVTAWLPPRAGQPARTAHGTVTLAAGGFAEVTLDITKP
jgi:hypothetical protein